MSVKSKVYYDRICLTCHKSFRAFRSDKYFCKPRCKYIHWKLNGKLDKDKLIK